MNFQTRVRIKKYTKLSEVASPTLNSISKVYPHYFENFEYQKKIRKKVRTLLPRCIFGYFFLSLHRPRSGTVRRTSSCIRKMLDICQKTQGNSRSACQTANQPLNQNICPDGENILCLWRPVSDEKMPPPFSYWYMKNKIEKYAHKPEIH